MILEPPYFFFFGVGQTNELLRFVCIERDSLGN